MMREMNSEANFRKPTPAEAELIQRLLMADFPGKAELAAQLRGSLVRQIDSNGSLELKPPSKSIPAPPTKRIPVEAEAPDQDGVHVHVLLHVVNGLVKEIEIYKDDGSPISRMPKPADFDLLVLPG